MKVIAHDNDVWGIFPSIRKVRSDYKHLDKEKISENCARKIVRLYGQSGVKFRMLIWSIIEYFKRHEGRSQT